MKKFTCLIIVAVLAFHLAGTPAEETGVPAKLQEEAARFHREALVMQKSQSYELALEKAEAAFALEPENQKYKDTLVHVLTDTARYLLVPESFLSKEIVATPERAARSLVLINRAFDLVEKDSRYFNAFQLGPDVNVFWGHCLVYDYCQAVRRAPKDIYPEWKAETDKFLNRAIADWKEFRYPHRYKLVEDKKTFDEWRRRATPPTYIQNYAPASVAATCYEEYFRDLFAFRKKYSDESLTPMYRLGIWGEFKRFANRHLSTTVWHPKDMPTEPMPPENLLARQIIERMLKTFSEQDSVFFDSIAFELLQEARLNHRLLEIPFPVVKIEDGRYVDFEKMKKDFQDYCEAFRAVVEANEKEILAKINSIPKDALLDDYIEIYSLLILDHNSFRGIVSNIESTYGKKLPRPSSTADRTYFAFLVALDRGDILYGPISEVAERGVAAGGSHSKYGLNWATTPEEIRRTADACKRGVEALDAGTASTGRGTQIDTNIRNILQSHYEALETILNPEPPPTHAPWKEEIVLSENEWIRYEVGPISMEGETLCVLLDKQDWSNAERLGWRAGTLVPVLINLETQKKTELASWYYLDKDHGNMGISSSETGPWQLFCGTKYVAVGSSYAGHDVGKKDFGIIVFPRDGTRASVFDENTGLPSNRVRGLGVLGDTLYAGVGDWYSATWLVKIDLPTRKVEILSPSRGKEGKAPFFDLEKAPQFRHFVYDAKRERLLFQVYINNRHPLEGLWTIDGKSGEIAQLSDRKELIADRYSGEILADGDTYLTGSSSAQFGENRGAVKHFLTDLRDGTVTPLIDSFSHCTVQQDWIWGLVPSATIKGEFYFARVKRDQSTESEKLLNTGTKESTFRATPDGKGIIRYDDRKIVLLRLE